VSEEWLREHKSLNLLVLSQGMGSIQGDLILILILIFTVCSFDNHGICSVNVTHIIYIYTYDNFDYPDNPNNLINLYRPNRNRGKN